MKKSLRKLVPAFVMILIAASLVGTSTYAWFSMNTTVEVTGMELSVKSDDTYLLISKTNTTASAIQAENSGAGNKTVDVSVDQENLVVKPSSPCLTSTEAAYLTTSGKKVGGETITTAGVVVDNGTKAAAVTNWFTAAASAPTAAAIDATTARQLTTFTGYVITKTVYLTVAAGSNPANNLTVTPTFTQKSGGTDIAAVKMLIVTSDGGFANLSSANNGSAVDIKGSNTDLDDDDVLTVTMYLYYDGDETAVYTNNMANLKGATISLNFDVTSHPAA